MLATSVAVSMKYHSGDYLSHLNSPSTQMTYQGQHQMWPAYISPIQFEGQ